MNVWLTIVLVATACGLFFRVAFRPKQLLPLISGVCTCVLIYGYDIYKLGYFEPLSVFFIPIVFVISLAIAMLLQKRVKNA